MGAIVRLICPTGRDCRALRLSGASEQAARKIEFRETFQVGRRVQSRQPKVLLYEKRNS
jgi:hypothetical protein